VTFSLNGTVAGNGSLNWTLTFGDGNSTNGTSLPAQAVHQFTPGNWTVVLTVGNGTTNATAGIVIQVSAGAAAEGPDFTFCERPDAVESPSGHYVDHRGGDSIWLYEESNSKPGLQVGGADEEAIYQACPDPDTLIF
jgi:PKD repeat protein